MNENTNTKLLRVSERTWEKIMDLKLHQRKRTVNDVIAGLLEKKGIAPLDHTPGR